MEKTLQDLLFNCLDMTMLLKHCHWNVKGVGFKPLHEFLDEIYSTVDDIRDDIAERMVMLQYPANGLSEDVARNSDLATLPVEFISTTTVISEIESRMKQLVDKFNKAVKDTNGEDPVTSNMLQDMTHQLEKHLWMLRHSK